MVTRVGSALSLLQPKLEMQVHPEAQQVIIEKLVLEVKNS